MSSCCFGVILLVLGGCFGELLVMRWSLATFRAHFDGISVMCGDFDDEWVITWCFVVDIAVLFFWFGVGILIFW